MTAPEIVKMPAALIVTSVAGSIAPASLKPAENSSILAADPNRTRIAECAAAWYRAEEEFHVSSTVERHVAVGLNREVSGKFEERRDADACVQYCKADNVAFLRSEQDMNILVPDRNRLIDGAASRV